MATYKVIQDIEAEDKLVGPLTLRQFIYAAVSAVCLYICFLAYSRNVIFLVGLFLPVALISGFFAFPWKGEQPTEIWALARLRFSIVPRVRIWDQEGAKDMVTVLAPKKLKDDRPVRTLTQSEVRSRLKALADTIDSRGWATRNAAYGIYTQTWAKQTVAPVPAPNPAMASLVPDEDMFDASNAVSQNLDAMLNKSQEAQRQRVMQAMAQAQNGGSLAGIQRQGTALPNIPTPDVASAYSVAPAPAPVPIPDARPMQQQPNNYWFANGPAYPMNPGQVQQIQQQPAPQPMPMPGGSLPMMPAPVLPQQPQAYAPSVQQMPTYTQPQPTQPLAPATFSNNQAPSPRIESDMPLAVSATPTAADAAAGQDIKQQNQEAMAISYGHMRVLQPSGAEQPASPTTIDPYQQTQPNGNPQDSGHDQYVDGAQPAPADPVTPIPNPAILDLAQNDDLDIATIARQASKEMSKTPDEVEIRLR